MSSAVQDPSDTPLSSPLAVTDSEDAAVYEAMRRANAVVPPRLTRPFTSRYVAALLAVALLTLGAQLLLHHLISQQGRFGLEVNLAGKQRMLSQQIALGTTRLTNGSADDQELRARLAASVALMERTQRGLSEGDVGLGLTGDLPPAVDRLLRDGTSARVTTFVADARAVLAADPATLRPDDPAARQVLAQATGPLLPALDDVVRSLQAAGDDAVDTLAGTERALLVVTLLVLLAEGLLVFRPMSGRIGQETARLESATRRYRGEAARQSFSVAVREALDLTTDEQAAGAALLEATELAGLPGTSSVLTVQAATGRMLPLVETASGCSVSGADGCPAVRRARVVSFTDSSRLGTCPRLRADHADAPVSATCAPVHFQGAPMAVIHTVGPAGVAADASTLQLLETLTLTAGVHLGTLRAFAQNRADAMHDTLTGLLNRRGLADRVRRLEADGIGFGAVMIDLDHFKQVNDAFGHDTGDRVLQRLGALLSGTVRPTDITARLGGEEFVVLLPGADTETALGLAERLRTLLETEALEQPGLGCTASFGVVGSGSDGLDGALRRADAAMYRAKSLGRNRVEAANPVTAVPLPRPTGVRQG